VFSTPAVPPPGNHEYRDGCGLDSHGSLWWTTWDLDASELPNFSLGIGVVPPPPALTDYSNQFVAIVFGPPPPDADISKVAGAIRFSRRKRTAPPPGPTPAARVIEALRRAAGYIGLPELLELLDPPPPVHVRVVRDIQGSPRHYKLASVFSSHLKRGVLAVLSPSDVLRHFEIHTHEDLAGRLSLNPQEDLWWTTKYLPALASPYFPFRRATEGNQAIYRRIEDDFTISGPLTPAQA
jgi:hypothetical protein